MKSNRRPFIQAAGTAGAAVLTLQTALADDSAVLEGNQSKPTDQPTFTTELFLDNQLLEATPGVSRKLHQAKKHLRNPVIQADRWCEGTYIEPYTTDPMPMPMPKATTCVNGQTIDSFLRWMPMIQPIRSSTSSAATSSARLPPHRDGRFQ